MTFLLDQNEIQTLKKLIDNATENNDNLDNVRELRHLFYKIANAETSDNGSVEFDEETKIMEEYYNAKYNNE